MQSANQEAVLIVTVNDLGNYGCYPDCVKMKTSPLSTQVSIHLNKRRPTGSTRTFCKSLNNITSPYVANFMLLFCSWFGFVYLTFFTVIVCAIITEILTMIVLGGVLLFFICRCMNDLYGKRKDSDGSATSSPSDENSRRQNVKFSFFILSTYTGTK